MVNQVSWLVTKKRPSIMGQKPLPCMLNALSHYHRLEITGIFRGVPVRVNPRQRTIKALFRTYLDVVHIKRSDQKRLAIDRSIINNGNAVVRYSIHIVM
jgi:DNA replicative helicase MCM subunit Mcm2 (Cdc46/Mcm family)